MTFFAAYGAYFLGKCAFTALRGFTKYMLLPRRNLKARYGGGWALVTGASDGIGKQYAIELAKSGFDIILMARNQEKTQGVADEISKTYGVQTRVIVFDFSTLSTEESIKDLENLLRAKLHQVDVSVLVNNVGVTKFAPFHETNWEEHMKQINVNVNGQTYMTKFVLPKFLDRDSRSAIVSISSVCHYYPMANLAMYCATKSYNFMFSRNLEASYSGKIDFLTVTPGGTKTNMYSGRYSFSVLAEDHGKAVIDQLGW